jgi:hypothetical protein
MFTLFASFCFFLDKKVCDRNKTLTERFFAAVDPQMFLQMMLKLESLSAFFALEAPQIGRLVV